MAIQCPICDRNTSVIQTGFMTPINYRGVRGFKELRYSECGVCGGCANPNDVNFNAWSLRYWKLGVDAALKMLDNSGEVREE